MKKVLVALLLLGLTLGFASTSMALQLLADPGFESGALAPNWSATNTDISSNSLFVHSGNYGTDLGSGNAIISQSFILPDAPTLEFGGWLRFFTTQPSGNWDQGQVNLTIYLDPPNQIDGGTGGSDPGNNVNSFDSIPGTDWDASDWIYISRVADIAGLAGRTATIRFNLQDPGGVETRAAWDDTFANVTVPEPATMLLLGTGLFGLAVLGRKRFIK